MYDKDAVVDGIHLRHMHFPSEQAQILKSTWYSDTHDSAHSETCFFPLFFCMIQHILKRDITWYSAIWEEYFDMVTLLDIVTFFFIYLKSTWYSDTIVSRYQLMSLYINVTISSNVTISI